MSSLVLELQQSIYNGKENCLELLRKAYVLSKKLKLKDFSEWIDCELKGYKKEIPPYRKIQVSLVAYNPVNGFIPVYLNTEVNNLLNNYDIRNSISELNDLLESDKGYFIIKVESEIEQALKPSLSANYPLYYRIERTQIKNIIDSIKNVLLDWSLNLEADGILGNNMSFSDNEKEIANNSNNINIFNNISDSQIQQNTNNSNQYIIKKSIDKDLLCTFINEVKNNIDSISLDDENKRAINNQLSILENQINSKNPDDSAITKSLTFIKDIIEKTAVSLSASGILYLIQQLTT